MANIKSAPQTTRTVLGKPKAQYDALTWITAKRRQAMLVAIVPSAADAGEKTVQGASDE